MSLSGTTLERVRRAGSYSRVHVPPEGPLSPEQGVCAFIEALERREPWYPALLHVIARWTAPEEVVEGVCHRYLLAGEAFDWLLLAERLLHAAREAFEYDMLLGVPDLEAEDLVVHGLAPEGFRGEEQFAEGIGVQKYRAHLNFQYGVVVEEVLLLAAEQELEKAGRLAGAGGPQADIAAYERVYGRPLDELMVLYRSETDAYIGPRVSQGEMRAFTYWCSKFRLKTAEPARVASDTRKALSLLSRLESNRAGRASATAAEAAAQVIDIA